MSDVRAHYVTRRGAHVSRTVRSADEAERLLRAARGEVTLRDDHGERVGGRERDPDNRWAWWFDKGAFS